MLLCQTSDALSSLPAIMMIIMLPLAVGRYIFVAFGFPELVRGCTFLRVMRAARLLDRKSVV